MNDYIKSLKSKKHVVAVSGGRDSMALLDMLKELDIVVAHINHKKRPESELEQSYLEEYCSKHHIPIEVGILPNQETNENFQAYAREFRYDFFEKTFHKHQADDIILAHHGDDLVETMLMSMVRGTSIKGLVPMRREYQKNGILYLRPLIDFTSEEIDQYVLNNQITYFKDSSNESDEYTRNRFRHNVLPILKQEQPKLVEKFLNLSEEVQELNDWILDRAHNYMKHEMQIDAFQKEPLFVQNEIFVQLLKKHHIAPHTELLKEMMECVLSASPNTRIQLSDELWLVKSYQKLIVQPMEELKPVYLELTEEGLHKIDTFHRLQISRINADSSDFSNELCYNDFDFPVIVRTRKPGDKIKMHYGTKKVKDLLIDLKIPLQERDKILLVEHKGNIVWIPELNIKSKQQKSDKKLYLTWIREE